MRLKGSFRTVMLVALGGAALNVEARAADLGPIYDTPSQSYAAPQALEFGSGWYLRGDGAYAEEDKPKFDNATARFDRKAKSDGYAFGVGAGYKMNSFLRMDVTADYLDRYDYAGSASCGPACGLAATNKVWRWDGLVNGYIDLGTWYGVTPYLGAGAGVSGTRQEADLVTTSNGSTQKKSSGATDLEFAWAAMAGFSYSVTSHAMIDVGYRYLDLGRTAIPLAPLAKTSKDIVEQQVRVGLRYMVD